MNKRLRAPPHIGHDIYLVKQSSSVSPNRSATHMDVPPTAGLRYVRLTVDAVIKFLLPPLEEKDDG